MKQEVLVGQTDFTVLVKIRDTAGAAKTGLTEASIDIAYARVETDNDVTTSDVTPAALSALTDAHTDWGFEEVSATDHPGLYRLDIADAVFAAGAWSAVVTVTGTGLDPADMEFVLVEHSPWADIANIYSDTAIIYSDTTIATSKAVQIYSDTTIIYSDTTIIYSDTTIATSKATQVYSDTTAIHTQATQAASKGVQIYSDTTIVTSKTTQIYSDTTAIHTQTTTASSKAVQIYSDTTIATSKTTQIYSDTTAIHTAASQAASKGVQVYSDTTIVTSKTTQIYSDTTAIHTQTTTASSKAVQIYSDTTIIYSDTTIIYSRVVVVHSETTVIQSDAALLEASHAEPTGVPSATASPLTKLGVLYMMARNQKTVTATKKTYYDDSEAAEFESDVSDDGSTYTESEVHAV